MRRLLFPVVTAVAAAAAALTTAPALAALKVGARAPDFTTVGALGGKAFRFHLADQLKQGPVVLYFYPKAFTKGCTLEAKAFADAMPAFRAAGATVIGMSADKLDTLKRFSTEACRSRFAVASADRKLLHRYDVAMAGLLPVANRTSYVLDRDGRVVMVHSEMDWSHHVAKTLAAVEALKAAR